MLRVPLLGKKGHKERKKEKTPRSDRGGPDHHLIETPMLQTDVLYGWLPDLPIALFPEASSWPTVPAAAFPEVLSWELSYVNVPTAKLYPLDVAKRTCQCSAFLLVITPLFPYVLPLE